MLNVGESREEGCNWGTVNSIEPLHWLLSHHSEQHFSATGMFQGDCTRTWDAYNYDACVVLHEMPGCMLDPSVEAPERFLPARKDETWRIHSRIHTSPFCRSSS
jgi:hypothetical protein